MKNLDIKDKLYIELENVPSFMDLTTQITEFIEKQNKEVDYELNYRNNVYKLLFSSNQIGFSFITFMNNLKFSNKYYRKLKINIHFKTIDKIRYELGNNNNEKEGNKFDDSFKKGMNFLYKSNKRKSKSYGILKNNKYNNIRISHLLTKIIPILFEKKKIIYIIFYKTINKIIIN